MIDTILLAGALFAFQGSVETPSTAVPAEADARRECRVVGEIGSRLARRRVCGTRAEWAEKDRQDRQAMNDGRQRTLSPTYDELRSGSGPSGNRPNARCARC
jgi:hypothetical protein